MAKKKKKYKRVMGKTSFERRKNPIIGMVFCKFIKNANNPYRRNLPLNAPIDRWLLLEEWLLKYEVYWKDHAHYRPVTVSHMMKGFMRKDVNLPTLNYGLLPKLYVKCENTVKEDGTIRRHNHTYYIDPEEYPIDGGLIWTYDPKHKSPNPKVFVKEVEDKTETLYTGNSPEDEFEDPFEF